MYRSNTCARLTIYSSGLEVWVVMGLREGQIIDYVGLELLAYSIPLIISRTKCLVFIAHVLRLDQKSEINPPLVLAKVDDHRLYYVSIPKKSYNCSEPYNSHSTYYYTNSKSPSASLILIFCPSRLVCNRTKPNFTVAAPLASSHFFTSQVVA